MNITNDIAALQDDLEQRREERAAAMCEMRLAGKSYATIAATFDVQMGSAYRTIVRHAHKHGITLPPTGAHPHSAQGARAYALREEGRRWADIGAALGTSEAAALQSALGYARYNKRQWPVKPQKAQKRGQR